MRIQENLIGLCLALCIFYLPLVHAQNWENPGAAPGYSIAYDQNGMKRTAVTSRNVYRSFDNGNSWQQMLSAANVPFYNPQIPSPDFYGFIFDRCQVFDDVIFLTANIGNAYSASEWILYNSIDGGNSLQEVMVENTAYTTNTAFGYDHDLYQVDADTYIIRFLSNGPSPTFSKANIYVSNDKGQSWSFLFDYPENAIEFAGATANDFVFLYQDQLIYRNKVTGALSDTLVLPEVCYAASVDNNNIRLISWTENSGNIRGYLSSDGGNSFSNLATTIPNAIFNEAQIFDDLIFVSGGNLSYNTKTYRMHFSNFNNFAQVTTDAFYSDFFPFRKTTDGQITNLIPGPKPHYPNLFYADDGNHFNAPIYVSNDEWATVAPADKPPYALEALPVLDGKALLHAGPYAWNTTDGINFNKAFPLSSWPYIVNYFQGAVQLASYFDPSTTFYLTNDSETVASNDTHVAGTGNTLYSWRRDGYTSIGIFSSVDQGDTWAYLNDGHFWGDHTLGDDFTNNIFSFERSTGSDGTSTILDVSRSIDQGLSWQYLPDADFSTIANENYFHDDFFPIVVYNNYFFVKSDTDFYYSTDGAATFQLATGLLPFSEQEAEMYLLGSYLCFKTSSEQFFRVNIDEWLGTQGGGSLPGANIDLSLSVSMNPPEPAFWTNFEVTYTITNNGDIPATKVGLEYFIASYADAVPQGGSTPTYVGLNGQGGNTLLPGESGTATYYYFRKDGEPIVAWGQLTSYHEPDVDSRRGNADYPEVNEDDEASTAVPDIPVPDLTISNFQITNPLVYAGNLLEYTYDLSNAGTADASGSFVIKAWISTDAILSADDVQDGIVPTGNFPAGFTANNVAASSYIATSLPPGDYYLILRADADGQISESNETNNTVLLPFSIEYNSLYDISNDPIPDGTYCPGAYIVRSSGKILTGGNVTIRAFQQICLEAGFEVAPGAEFLGEIGVCPE